MTQNKLNRRMREAARYLGYGRKEIDASILALIEECFEELEEIAEVRWTYKTFLCTVLSGKLKIAGQVFASKNLCKNISGCEEVLFFAVTLGPEVDRRLKRYQVMEVSRAAVLQACSAAYLEEVCDQYQEQLEVQYQKEGKYLRPRFSPGYGDFAIQYQEEVLKMLDAAKKIGLTRTESYMLTPSKSVTALIGVGKEQTRCPKSGCEVCEKKDCAYRRN